MFGTENALQQEPDYYLINGTCFDNSYFLYSLPKDLANEGY